MRDLTYFLASLLAVCVNSKELDFNKWQAPQVGDARGPCPALNALANHNFLPRDGHSITVDLIRGALMNVFKFDPEETSEYYHTKKAIEELDKAHAGGVFSLDALNRHRVFEHDGSLTRCDVFSTESWCKNATGTGVQPKLLAQFLNHFNGTEFVDIKTAANARWDALMYWNKTNDAFDFSQAEARRSLEETAMYYLALTDGTRNKTPVSWVKALLGEERVPYKEGYDVPPNEINGTHMNATLQKLLECKPEHPKDTLWTPGKCE